MHFVADLHIHSRFARATSKELTPETLYRWACLKGVTVLGTGDFTHPAWVAELKDRLEPAEEGLYRLKSAYRTPVEAGLPALCRDGMRFLLSVEISLIYKKDDRTRKVHHVVMMPNFEAVERLNARLEDIGNLKSDGRPILGLDSRDLVEICLEACEDVLFIPAHIWTPHFAVLGSASGFDCLEACFEDMLPHIYAVETGLSSDPPMNWRLSMLDRYAIVSNSDAHSAQKLAREATCFDTEMSYPAIYDALKTRDPSRLLGTLEFYPEEGKYHLDGHRKCEVCWSPPQTLEADGVCPVCGKRLTVGVLHRVAALADRPEGAKPDSARSYESLIPLPEVIGSAYGVGANSKKVQGVYHRLLSELGPELDILRTLPVEAIAGCGEGLVAEGVRRMRAGEVHIQPGYDGVYGAIRVFTDGDRSRVGGQSALFDLPSAAPPDVVRRQGVRVKGERGKGKGKKAEAEGDAPGKAGEAEAGALIDALDGAQRRAVEVVAGPVAVVAGPGSGKTRVLTHRVAHLVRHLNVLPQHILAVTFTNRAAEEMRRRIQALLPDVANVETLTVGTFHRVAHGLLKAFHADGAVAVADALEARGILQDAMADCGISLPVSGTASAISLAKANGLAPEDVTEDRDLQAAYRAYQERLDAFGVRDYDDILLALLHVFESEPEVLKAVQRRFAHLLVDEFQDVNAVQYRLVRLMAGDGAGLFVIGDPDQAIYGFRGASPAFFDRLSEDFSNSQQVLLDATYRSTPEILAAASGVIAQNAGRDTLRLAPRRESGRKIRLLEVPGETAEGIAVVREINRMVGGADMLQSQGDGGRWRGLLEDAPRSFGDFGVLFRTGRQADVLEACFLEEGLPYRIVGQKGFLDAEPVRQALAFFRFVFRPERDMRFLNALTLPSFTPGEKALADLRRRLGQGGLPDPLPPKVSEKVDALVLCGERYRTLAAEEDPACLLRRWGNEYGVADAPTFDRFVRVAARAGSVDRLLDTVLFGQEADYELLGKTGQGQIEAVTLMTLHAAKGLEFPVVFICGVEDGLVPFRERDADQAEERRLFYVGLTRARDEAVLLHAQSRTRYGKRIRPDVSPFVRDIPEDVLEKELIAPERRRGADQLSLF